MVRELMALGSKQKRLLEARRKMHEVDRLLAEHETDSDTRDALLHEVDKKLALCAHFAGEIATSRVLEILPVGQRGVDTTSRCSDHGGSPAASNSSRSFSLRAGSAKGTRETN